jgi:NAD(P)H-flavin reductase
VEIYYILYNRRATVNFSIKSDTTQLDVVLSNNTIEEGSWNQYYYIYCLDLPFTNLGLPLMVIRQEENKLRFIIDRKLKYNKDEANIILNGPWGVNLKQLKSKKNFFLAAKGIGITSILRCATLLATQIQNNKDKTLILYLWPEEDSQENWVKENLKNLPHIQIIYYKDSPNHKNKITPDLLDGIDVIIGSYTRILIKKE